MVMITTTLFVHSTAYAQVVDATTLKHKFMMGYVVASTTCDVMLANLKLYSCTDTKGGLPPLVTDTILDGAIGPVETALQGPTQTCKDF